MAGNLPPGVTPGDIDDAFSTAEECQECGGVYAEDGHIDDPDTQLCRGCDHFWEGDEDQCPQCGSWDVGGAPCPNDGMTAVDIEEARRSQHAEMRMEEKRLQERLDNE